MNNFISKRGKVSNFIVMDLFEQANQISNKGKKIIHFEAGQPTDKLPKKVFTRANKVIKNTNVIFFIFPL